MRILTVASVFPPTVIGGAEVSAYNLARWLAIHGHDVGVLTVAEDRSQELKGELVDGLTMWRLRWPRFHTLHQHKHKSPVEKLAWHLQDHYDPRNGATVARVLEEFKPAVVVVHIAQGIGHNILPAFAQYPDLKVFYVLHDLTLACYRTSMYRGGGNCERQCAICKLSSAHKMKYLRSAGNVHLISPSRSNLETLNSLLNLGQFNCQTIPNLDLDEPIRAQPRAYGQHELPRLIYVGRLDPTKGIDFLLRILNGLYDEGHRFKMTIVGDGPLREKLSAELGNREWLTFAGHVAPSQVKGFISQADLLLLPSVWREVLGNVVRQALRAGVPAVVSDIGGPKELVQNGITGLVLKAGDTQIWKSAIADLLGDNRRLIKLQQNAQATASSYSADEVGARFVSLFRAAIDEQRAAATA